MMIILFVTGLYPIDYIEKYKEQSCGSIQNAANVFQWNIIDGLQKNNVDFEVVSLPFIPAFPFSYKSLFTFKGNIVSQGKKIGEMLRFCDLVIYKTYSMERQLMEYVEKWVAKQNKGEKLIILTYTPYVPFMKVAKKIKDKYSDIYIASIVTDLVDNMNDFPSNRSFFKRIQCLKETYETKRLYKYIDKFILLSEAMVEKIPEASGRYIVMEGISKDREWSYVKKNNKLKTLLYSGSLLPFACIDDLVNAFQKIDNPSYQLLICGDGVLKSMVIQAANVDSRIKYLGTLPHDEVILLQQQATLLINPRKPDCGITRFSFPSKTVEYMTSGTPMLGYKLEGIPSEYYEYFYPIEGLDEQTLIREIDNTLSLSQEILDKKAKGAFDFVQQNKNSQAQISKILHFLYE